MNRKQPATPCNAAPEACANPIICPLNQVKAGTVVCVRELTTSPEISDRLREMGLREDSHVRLVSRQDSVICLVCNARVALSQKLAESILVEPVTT